MVLGSTWILDVRALGNQTLRVRKVIHTSTNSPKGIQLHSMLELLAADHHPSSSSRSVFVRKVSPECQQPTLVQGRRYILFTRDNIYEEISLMGWPLPRSKKLVKSIKALLSEQYGKRHWIYMHMAWHNRAGKIHRKRNKYVPSIPPYVKLLPM